MMICTHDKGFVGEERSEVKVSRCVLARLESRVFGALAPL